MRELRIDPHSLPVYRERDRIVTALRDQQVVVVESPTGSGKTTQLPIILHEAGYARRGVIGVTQPRRIATLSVSEFIAAQIDPAIVGYKMRFDDQTSPETLLKILTDGTLLQEMKADPDLSRYSVIMIDEAHERSLNIDFILGLLKQTLKRRPEFRVIVSSATINAEIFSTYFDGAPVIRIDSQMFPVDIQYRPLVAEGEEDALIAAVVSAIGEGLEKVPDGDFLVFLSGERAIRNCMDALNLAPFRRQLHPIPLFGRLSKDEQELVFVPPPEGKRKVVVSTNIAETSITIDGVTVVVDSGLSKVNYYSPRTYTSSLVEGPISRASAEQRKGRAGRTRPGVCFRLYSQEDMEHRPLFTTEEIFRTDLSEVVLRMSELGIRDFARFDFISPPNQAGLGSAVDTLHLLQAIDQQNALTEIGKMMSAFPLTPRHSRIIVEAVRRFPRVTYEAVCACAFLTTENPFLLPEGLEIEARRAHHRFRDPAGDFTSHLRLLEAYESSNQRKRFADRHYLEKDALDEIINVRDQLLEIVSSLGVPVGKGGSVADYLTAVATGLIQFVCVREGKQSYRSLTANRIQIHPGSVLFRESPEYIVAGEVVRTSRTYARTVSPLERSWIRAVSEDLERGLTRQPGRGSPDRPSRDTTWQVSIGHRSFPMRASKGKKKEAVLNWRDFRRVVSALDAEVPPHLSGLRGVLIHDGAEVAAGSRLRELVLIAACLDPERHRMSGGLRRGSMDALRNPGELCKLIGSVFHLYRMKKSARGLGFLALHCTRAGQYWLAPARTLSGAASETLSSLEQLADDLPRETEEACLDRLSRLYRVATDLIEGRPTPLPD